MLTTNKDGSVVLGDATSSTQSLALKPEAGKALADAMKSGRLNLPADGEGGAVAQPSQIWYTDDPAENPNQYVGVTFEDREVLVRDGNDPTGKAIRYGFAEWRDLVGQDEDKDKGKGKVEPDPTGKGMASRTADSVQRDREAGKGTRH